MKINALGENFAPTKNWYVKTINKLFEMGGDMITSELSNKFITTLSDFEKEIDAQKFRDSTIKIYLKILKKNPNIPDAMMRVIAWVFGEYGSSHPDKAKKEKILSRICDAAWRQYEEPDTRVWIISSITKIHFSLEFEQNDKVDKVIKSYSSSKNLDIHQRCMEYKQMK